MEDVVELREGKLAARGSDDRATAPRDATRVDEAPPTPPGLAAALGATRWEQIRITPVDGHTVRIEANGQALLRTFVELGFVDGRKREVVTPISAWALFLVFCREGRVKPSAYAKLGVASGAKKAIERIGSAMRQAFGLDQHPIHSYSKKSKLWEARFLAASPSKTKR